MCVCYINVKVLRLCVGDDHHALIINCSEKFMFSAGGEQGSVLRNSLNTSEMI